MDFDACHLAVPPLFCFFFLFILHVKAHVYRGISKDGVRGRRKVRHGEERSNLSSDILDKGEKDVYYPLRF